MFGQPQFITSTLRPRELEEDYFPKYTSGSFSGSMWIGGRVNQPIIPSWLCRFKFSYSWCLWWYIYIYIYILHELLLLSSGKLPASDPRSDYQRVIELWVPIQKRTHTHTPISDQRRKKSNSIIINSLNWQENLLETLIQLDIGWYKSWFSMVPSSEKFLSQAIHSPPPRPSAARAPAAALAPGPTRHWPWRRRLVLRPGPGRSGGPWDERNYCEMYGCTYTIIYWCRYVYIICIVNVYNIYIYYTIYIYICILYRYIV